ncbi:bacteriocin-like protein [Elizabethkingia bruuniana]|uniref:bacteriocin-like protein n=1 Tax=Elizabethkingia bruuniana TaxID=1756149 RepID=UPI000999C92B|nr:hypothetical protein [Elizabethkingia bruuniana]RBI93850.1 hypothetical protein DSC47_02860 [Elizabethkingia miricola]
MKNFKKLSRTDLKKVTGRGLACTYSIQDRNGNWTTFSGECRSWPGSESAYCDIGVGSGPLRVTSNGGKSRC